jgi:hypothetical protein
MKTEHVDFTADGYTWICQTAAMALCFPCSGSGGGAPSTPTSRCHGRAAPKLRRRPGGAAAVIAQAVPDGPRRLEPYAAFAQADRRPADASSLARILATLSRSPAWPN